MEYNTAIDVRFGIKMKRRKKNTRTQKEDRRRNIGASKGERERGGEAINSINSLHKLTSTENRNEKRKTTP